MTEMRLRVLIADDEEIARKRLVRLLSSAPEVELVGQCGDGSEVLEWLARDEAEVEVLLLDIRMPSLSGLEAKAMMPDDGPYVIFTTAYQEHAIEAFDVGAVDYLLKPIEAARLNKALDRARTFLSQPLPAARESTVDKVDRIPVQTRNGIVLVDPEELSHARFDGELVTLHTRRGELLCDYTLQELEQRLGGADQFVRVHRRALLNLASVDRLEPLETGGLTAHMREGGRVPVSRQAARRLRKRLGLS